MPLFAATSSALTAAQISQLQAGTAAEIAGAVAIPFVSQAGNIRKMTFAQLQTALGISSSGSGNSSPTLVSPAFFVSPSGSDSNPGTQASPFLTLGKACTAMGAGGGAATTTYVRGGSYTPSAMVNIQTNGISFLAFPGETPVINASGITTPFYINLANTVTVSGFTINAPTTAGIGLHGYTGSGASNCTITYNNINNVAGDASGGAGATGGIRCDFLAQNNTIAYNKINGTPGPSITLVAGKDSPTQIESVAGNNISNNSCINSNTQQLEDTGAIYVCDRGHTGNSTTLKTTISYNYVQDFSPNVKGNDNTHGIYLDDETNYVVGTGNVITGKGHFGYHFHGGDNISFTYDIVDLTQIGWVLLDQDDVSSGFPNYGGANKLLSKCIFFAQSTYANSTLVSFLDSTNGSYAATVVSGCLTYSTVGTLPTAGTIGGVVGNPLFVNPAIGTYNYAFQTGGAAKNIGFPGAN